MGAAGKTKSFLCYVGFLGGAPCNIQNFLHLQIYQYKSMSYVLCKPPKTCNDAQVWTGCGHSM